MPKAQPTRTPRSEKTRRGLREAADSLFYERGIRATGVGAVAERAGVTKMTLYAHFASKDDLVVAYLEERDRRWRESLERRLAGEADPKERLLAVFDAYREWLVSGGLRGCAYVNCAAEFPDREHPVRRMVREHKAGLRRRLSGLAAEAGAADPETLAERLFVLLEGAYVSAALEGDEDILDRIRLLAKDLVAVPRTGSRG